MTISTPKRVLGGLVAASMFIALAGCASAPEETEATEEATSNVVEGFKPCMVSDAGGFDDKSFNQLGYEGLESAADELGVEFLAVELLDELGDATRVGLDRLQTLLQER